MIKISERLGVVGVRHNSPKSKKIITKLVSHSHKFIFGLELTAQDAYYIRKKGVIKSEFYPILTNQNANYFLMDLSMSELLTKGGYQKSVDGSVEFSFDRLFCKILNRYGYRSHMTSEMPSKTLLKYKNTMYDIREEYMAQ